MSEITREVPRLRHAPDASLAPRSISGLVIQQLQAHAPFTLMGTATGIVLLIAILATGVPASWSGKLFWTLHPLHVVLSALVTTAMYELHGRHTTIRMLLVGYIGSVGIATLSDSVMPYFGEWLLDLPNRGIHLGFIEKWWLVNPLAIAGILLGRYWPHTRFPHAGHVLLSTWASLFHMTMAFGDSVGAGTVILCGILLFIAVWVPCCTSDIVFPLLFVGGRKDVGFIVQEECRDKKTPDPFASGAKKTPDPFSRMRNK